MDALTLLAQSSGGGGGLGGAIFGLIWLGILVLVIAGGWKMFTKAGQPGWGIIIPIFNLYLMIEIAERPAWWLILFFIPIVNIIVGFIVMKDIAERFGKGIGFALGLMFLGFIFIPILGFGSAEYTPQK